MANCLEYHDFPSSIDEGLATAHQYSASGWHIK